MGNIATTCHPALSFDALPIAEFSENNPSAEPSGIFDHHQVTQETTEGPGNSHRALSETSFFHQEGAEPTPLEKLSWISFTSLQEQALSTIATLYREGTPFDSIDQHTHAILLGARKHLDSVNSRLELLQQHVPEERELIETLTSYQQEFQNIYNNASVPGHEKGEPILKSFKTPIRALQTKEQGEEHLALFSKEGPHESRAIIETEHSLFDKLIASEEQTLAHLFKDPPEIKQAAENQKIVTAYYKAATSFHSRREQRMQAVQIQAAGNMNRAILMEQDIAWSSRKAGDAFLKQAKALEKAREVCLLSEDIAMTYARAATCFQSEGEYRIQSAQANTREDEELASRLDSRAAYSNQSGEDFLHQATALEKAAHASNDPKIANIYTQAAGFFKQAGEYVVEEARLSEQGGPFGPTFSLTNQAIHSRNTGEDFLNQATALEKAAHASNEPEIADIYTQAAGFFEQAGEHHLQAVYALQRGELFEPINRLDNQAAQSRRQAHDLMRQAAADVLDQSSWRDVESDPEN